MNKFLGYVLVIGSGLCSAMGGICAQYLMETRGFESTYIAPIRLMASGILLFLFLLITKRQAVFAIWHDKKDILTVLAFGVFGVAMCSFCNYTCLGYSNAPTATFMCFTSPIIIILYTVLRTRTLPTPFEFIAVILAIGGVFICATHGNIHTLVLSKEALFWGILSSAAFAVYTLSPQRVLKKFDLPFVSAWGCIFGGILLCILFRPWEHPYKWDLVVVACMTVISVFGMILSITFYLTGVKKIGTKKGGILAASEPVTSTILAMLFLNVVFEPIDFVGFGLILSTVFILALDKKGEAPAPSAEADGPADTPAEETAVLPEIQEAHASASQDIHNSGN